VPPSNVPRTRRSRTKPSREAHGIAAAGEPAGELVRDALVRLRTRERVRTLNDRFRGFAALAGNVLGSPWAFLLALVFVVAWALSGPYFEYSNAWQLVVNTSTTIATFLMVFLLQSTQNRDTKAINIKLDELLRAIAGARTGLADLRDLTDDEIDRIERELVEAAREAGVDPLPLQQTLHARHATLRATRGAKKRRS
jgi:low affinity Fe/Cu permease